MLDARFMQQFNSIKTLSKDLKEQLVKQYLIILTEGKSQKDIRWLKNEISTFLMKVDTQFKKGLQ